ncbi:aminoacyl-tRNA deacylase [Candidatus Nanohalovita haloferacivicina]|uniref:aminoacyl-tRNA deacylase n=1 Tax=Candidatus Nanohalovita haloferacivicina TaxID=2978046 RepID=UPI00325FB4A8|nr:Cys-tRNA(Pro) deacylase, prolyl-tRNA editing enzyme YbaK/EbsC [Candidatus Nanohalobia archaeon BNXNv]
MSNYFNQSPDQLKEFLGFIEKDIDNVRRVIDCVEDAGLKPDFMVHAKSETVEESAENTDIEEKEIIKTLIFMADEPVAVLCPGHTSVSEEKLEEIKDTEVRMASPDEVTDATGYYIGGVSPFDLEIPVYMEEKILEQDKVKPAAGSRVVGVTISSEDLKKVTEAEVVDVAR